jgi:O-antigen/teichoic acid export membrane protein
VGFFGQYTTIMTYASVFAIAADMGLTLVASQMINRVGVDEKKILANLFAFRSLTALVMIGLAPLTVWWMPYDLVTKIGVVVATMSFWFVSANQVFVSVFQKASSYTKDSAC